MSFGNFSHILVHLTKQQLGKESHLVAGLCHDCSYKVNYHHKRKEVTKSKRRKHREDSDKRESKKKKKRTDEDATEGTEEVKESSVSGEPEVKGSLDDIWKGPAKLPDEKSREEEFEEYLEDLFL